MSQFIPFNTVDINYLTTQLEQKINAVQLLVSKIETSPTSTWNSIIAPLHNSLYELNYIWSIAEHLQSVKDSPELRDFHEKYQPILTDLYVGLGQNQQLYQQTQAIKDQEYSQLNAEQQKVVDNELRDFRLSGITLAPEQQQEYKKIQNIKIINSIGQIVFISDEPIEHHILLNNLSKGMYFLQIESNKGTVVKKIMKD